jgi:hypothetical protein
VLPVQGLPEEIGPLAAALLVLGCALGAVYALHVHRLLATAFAASGVTGAVASWAVAAALAVGVGVTPFVVWRVVEDLRYTTGLGDWLAQRYGVSVSEIHPAAYDRLLQLVGPGDTYAVREDPRLGKEVRDAFEQWALTTLLPRRAVADLDHADWLVTLGVRPGTVDPRVVRSWRLHPGGQGVPPSYAGKLAS